MLRFLTAGESHGFGLVAILEGLPAGLKIEKEKINELLALRQAGYGRSERQTKIEQDKIEILSGLKGGITLGSPVALLLRNKDASMETAPAVFCPRPGHADLAGALKYNHQDLRSVLERASARETAIKTAVGAVCKIFLEEFDILSLGHTVAVSDVRIKRCGSSFGEIRNALKESLLRCADKKAEKLMMKRIDKAGKAGDTLGGVFEIIVKNVPAGLGSYVHYDRRLDAMLAGAFMAIPSVKAVEIGVGFEASALEGSKVHDEIFYSGERGFYRNTNNAGGIEGGVSNGEDIVIRAGVKPIPTLMKPLSSVNMKTKKKEDASVQRSDVCVVPACGIIGEAVAAFEISKVLLEKFGSDNMRDIRTAFNNYKKEIRI